MALVAVSCKKDSLPEATEGAVAFQSEFQFDGADYTLAAGVNGLVMQPTVLATDSTVTFTTVLAQPGCPDCGPALEWTIQSPPNLNPATVNNWIEELDSWDYLLLETTQPESTHLVVNLSPGNDFSTGTWFLNGEPLNQTPQNSIEVELESAGAYSFSFVPEDGSCTEGLERTLIFDGENIPCFANTESNPDFPWLVTATLGPGFDPDSTLYMWSYADIIQGPNSDPTVFIDSLIPLPLEVCLEVSESTGCSDNFCLVVTEPNDCATNIAIQSAELITIPPVTFDGALVQVTFTDENGQPHTSEPSLLDQGTVQLLSIEPYEEPTQPGIPFARLTFQLTTTLYDPTAASREFSGLVEIACALP